MLAETTKIYRVAEKGQNRERRPIPRIDISLKALFIDLCILAVSVLGLMWASPILHTEGAVAGFQVENKLLIIGFILLIGSFAGRVAHHVHLPRLTGFLIAGVLIGPESPIEHLRLIWRGDLIHIQFVKDLAIGLIALMAGTEIRMAWLRARFKGISSVIIWETLCVTISIMALVLFLWPQMPFAQSVEAAMMPTWVVALLIGFIALANSPMVVISVIKENKSEGPVTEMAMGVSVFKDVVVILGFTIVIAIAMAFEAGASGQTSIAGAGTGVLMKILISIGIGFAIGFFLKKFSEKTDFRLTWILIGLATIVAILEPYGIKPLFCLLAAGFACENLGRRSEHGTHHLECSLARVGAPVFILFFVSAGLHLHLDALYSAWPLILAIVVVRAFMIYVSVAMATNASQQEQTVRKNLWTAMIPQAGVSISLAAIVAIQFPDWGAIMATLIVAAIAINELVGPVLFARGLKQARESQDS